MKPEEMRVVAEFASLAPSVHNTQPWRFVARRYTLEVHADLERRLDYLDPAGRQLLLSCGAAVEFARLAIRSLGSACTVKLLPSQAIDTLVATLTVGLDEPPSPAEQRLIDAVPRRYTDRGPYSEEPVSDSDLQRVREAVAERSCWLRVLDKPGDRLSAILLLADAEAAEASDIRYREELAKWRRAANSPDGISTAAVSTWDDPHRVTDVPLRDFGGANARPHSGGPGEPPAVERDTLVLLGTDSDDQVSWLRAGRALADALLVLTDSNLSAQPLGPVLDVPATRGRLRHDLGLVGYPQLLLRVGRGVRRPQTGRRRVDDVFTSAVSP